MASGRINGSYRGFEVYTDWSSSINIAGNYSDVTANHYLYMPKGWSLYIGTRSNTCTCNESKSFTSPSISNDGGSAKTIHLGTTTHRVYHNADGTKTINLTTVFNMKATISGTYVGSITASGNITLDTIPRASSITSSGDYTKGDSVTVTLSRASTEFSHTVQFLIGSEVVKEITGVGTSATWTPTKSEVETLLSKGTNSTIRLYTYSGGTHIGTDTKAGTASNPTSSTISNDFSFVVGNKTSFNINRNKNYYTHSLEISVAGNLIKTISDVGTSTEWTPSTSELTAIYNAMSNTAKSTISVKCITYSRGANIGNTTKTGNITINETGNTPTFNNWSYVNNNSISNSVLGTNQVALQNHNSIVVTCNEAVAKHEASIAKYQVIVNNAIYETTNLTSRQITIPNLNLSGEISFQVRAIDTRGFITTVTKVITFIAYEEPKIPEISLERRNNYDEQSSLKLSGTISLIRYNNQSKNAIDVFKYRYKESGASNYNQWVDILTSTIPETAQKFHYDSLTGNFNLDEVEIGNFDKKKTYQFEFVIKDKVTELTFEGLLINGLPLMALRIRKVGINCVPDSNGKDGLYINGNFVPYESIIYDSSNGETGNITLNESLEDSEYIVIEYKANNIFGSIRVSNPVNKKISLVIMDPSTSTIYSKNITVNEESINVNSYLRAVIGGSNSNNNDISIMKVIKGN